MAGNAYSVDMTQATRPAFEAAKAVDQLETSETIRKGHQQQMAINKYQIDKMEKEKKWNETEVPLSSVFKNIKDFPEAKEEMMNIAKAVGAKTRQVGDETFISNEDMKRGFEFLHSNLDAQKTMNDLTITGLTRKLQSLNDPEYIKQNKLDPKAVEEAKDVITKQLNVHWSADKDIQKAVAVQKAKNADKLTRLKAGEKAVDAAGNTVAEVPAKPEKAPDAIRTFETVTGLGEKDRGTPKYKKAFNAFTRETSEAKRKPDSSGKWKLMTGVTDDKGNPVSFRIDEDGEIETRVGDTKIKRPESGKKPKEKANLVLDSLKNKKDLSADDIGKALQSGAISQDEAVALGTEKGIIKKQ